MAREASNIPKERFTSELPIHVHDVGETLVRDLSLESFTELIRRSLGVYIVFWEKKKREQPVATRHGGNRIQIIEDPAILRTGEIKRKNLEMASWWHRRVEALAEEQSTSKVAIVCKEILLVRTLKHALQQEGEVGYMVDKEFRPVIYELLISIMVPGIRTG